MTYATLPEPVLDLDLDPDPDPDPVLVLLLDLILSPCQGQCKSGTCGTIRWVEILDWEDTHRLKIEILDMNILLLAVL